ncbi:MAG TPA: 2-C-methyl-D-erythritol 4-phosphate cytidylyltransferase [Sediminibacterium sp.]|uniref:2-C-methyl-D-erythritol 4-phosphate cytidylyltransferase n=1 Tax=Sediminibacterium sp. TaxID=1917865 RepID=UPI0008CDBD25|nr:2-C-methyl-D-erythritol 4-phosphate cytidylyltransferase [Sediminibacterium sp.]MBT9483544.1 2-C-methyl-D-erythritol 4-phosphate cytidylyltransferase [Sediminibacterium sp.]OHC85654.1 MAG: 2-C-methyl-D-erythritol 4-phosphate cytidylyltransferase [Sphingobacteriia bacterium RIFOXYC2_FULL_35_18]OHC87191.1 MAG: 2-C-methyl-D-erythritol 4-phosphate cytidylyltransferase [Sphingobacteriia bacterium RIFOXYD2_FULL_35_12]HLD52703.1 2-C-methyl-D-erythritol 4-phosphate cytidylyltransferase [Sediminibact
MQKIAIITAGGSGTRMGSPIPKQFLLLNEKPLLWYTISAFLEAYQDISILLVLPKDYLTAGQELINEMGITQQASLVVGGSTRFHSVQNGILQIKNPAVVFVHDGVRCLLTPNLIKRCFEQTIEKGSAIPVVTCTDSVRIVNNNDHSAINRDQVKIVQTPQTFLSSILVTAFNRSYQDSFTDEATVVEASGESVHLIEGEYSNLKVTRPTDLLLARAILDERKK